MKPLPASPLFDSGTPSTPHPLDTPMSPYSKSNRRAASNNAVTRAYPFLLLTSTAIAAVFCMMYITKPVVITSGATVVSPSPLADAPTLTTAPAADSALTPRVDRLPVESSPPPVAASAPHQIPSPLSPVSAFEHTNLRIQHILTAEAPGGHLAKIDLDVPVLYQSRNLRWTSNEVADARKLLARLADYQEQSQRLRTEGAELLDAWNQLIARSIPTSDLRADSPSLPVNQPDSTDSSHPAGLDTNKLIHLQSTQ